MKPLRLVFYTIFLIVLGGRFSLPPTLADDATIIVGGEGGAWHDLQAALDAAPEGALVEVHGGTYTGHIEISKPLTLRGVNWPVIDGLNQGSIISISAPDVTISGFVIRNSGSSLDEENAGIESEAPRTVIENNRFENILFGVYLREAHNSVIRANTFVGKEVDLPRRGDAIRVWSSHNTTIEGNRVSRGRDVVLWYSEHLLVRENIVEDGRYGLHFMYCDDADVSRNILRHNSVGAFLMYSRRLHLHHNRIESNRGPSGYGVGLKDMDDAIIEENIFADNRIGAFLDNSPREVDSTMRFAHNVFAYNDIGVAMLPSVKRNEFYANSFIENVQQVAIEGGSGGDLSGNTWQGNYWSDYAGFDANNDGIGDVPYRAQRLFENLTERKPETRILLYSPVMQAVEFAARVAPLVQPQPKFEDTQPRMQPSFPQGIPALPPPSPIPMLLLGVSLLSIAGGIMLVAMPRRKQTHLHIAQVGV
ncbi:nitrous oxidase accessory protein [Ardenticatena maritima]|uniref:Nitrous oxidase accessory protein n=1 Tax=Ardenticatena maritima TaxID=872965 RepID=A0A0M8K651_9CHLR|nr:nitrous oxide reductase family maturation protein NosD [Ardenticatena maritima]GAP62555.1 nitrous oxidase accessory protein [Ardenticatena maritima]